MNKQKKKVPMWSQLPTLTNLLLDKLGQLSSGFQCHLRDVFLEFCAFNRT